IELVESGEFSEYKGLAIQLLEQYDSVQLLATTLKMLTGEKKEVNIELTPEEPLRAKKRRPDVRSSGRTFNRSGSSSSGGYRGSSGSGSGSRDRRSSNYKGNSDNKDNNGRSSYKRSSDGRSDYRRPRSNSNSSTSKE